MSDEIYPEKAVDSDYFALFDIPDRREGWRFGVSAVLSVVVNVLFLLGAGVLVTPIPDVAPPDPGVEITIIDPPTPRPVATPTPTPRLPEVKPTPAPTPPPIEAKPTPPPVERPRPEPPTIAPKPHHADAPPTTAPPLVLAARSNNREDAPSFVVPKGKAGSEGSQVGAPAGVELPGAKPGGTGTTPNGTGGTEHVEAAPKPLSPEPPAPTAPPPPPPPPKPVGPSRDAEADSQVNPEIPDELKSSDFKTSVRVEVDIDASGSFTPVLKTSSGNTQIDRLVLEALKKWRWKPALKDGDPVASTQRFRFEIEVQ